MPADAPAFFGAGASSFKFTFLASSIILGIHSRLSFHLSSWPDNNGVPFQQDKDRHFWLDHT